MKILFVTLIIVFLLIQDLSAQKKINFSSQNYAGLIAGEVNSELQLQTINGIKKGPWFAGAGVGIDWYYIRSIPVFASVNRSFFQKGKRSFLLSGDIGANVSWRGKINIDFPPYGDGKQKNGLYWAAGAGYKLGVGKFDNSLILQLGYSYKKMGEETTEFICPFIGPCYQTTTRYDYRLRRLSFKIGWGF